MLIQVRSVVHVAQSALDASKSGVMLDLLKELFGGRTTHKYELRTIFNVSLNDEKCYVQRLQAIYWIAGMTTDCY